MFSGKSEELIRRLRRAEIAGQRALIVKPAVDDRYDVGHVVSHAGAKMRAVTARRPAPTSRGLRRATTRSGSTRCSSSTTAIVEAISALVARGARVVAAGLAQDFRGEPLRLDADAPLRRRVRRQARGRLPPLRRARDADAAAGRRPARAVRRRDRPDRRARLVRGALPRAATSPARTPRAPGLRRSQSRTRSVLAVELDGAAERRDRASRDERAEVLRLRAVERGRRAGRDRRQRELAARDVPRRRRRVRRRSGRAAAASAVSDRVTASASVSTAAPSPVAGHARGGGELEGVRLDEEGSYRPDAIRAARPSWSTSSAIWPRGLVDHLDERGCRRARRPGGSSSRSR